MPSWDSRSSRCERYGIKLTRARTSVCPHEPAHTQTKPACVSFLYIFQSCLHIFIHFEQFLHVAYTFYMFVHAPARACARTSLPTLRQNPLCDPPSQSACHFVYFVCIFCKFIYMPVYLVCIFLYIFIHLLILLLHFHAFLCIFYALLYSFYTSVRACTALIWSHQYVKASL